MGKRIEASSEQRVLLDVDGEQPGQLAVIIDMVPKAIHLSYSELLPDVYLSWDRWASVCWAETASSLH